MKIMAVDLGDARILADFVREIVLCEEIAEVYKNA